MNKCKNCNYELFRDKELDPNNSGAFLNDGVEKLHDFDKNKDYFFCPKCENKNYLKYKKINDKTTFELE